MQTFVRVANAAVYLCILSVTANAAADVLEEIVVTADYRQRPLQDLPASISVLDSGTIDELAVAHFEELSHLVPNLNFAGGSNRPRYFQIRGVGERSQYEGAPNPSVGFIIDDIDFSAIGGVALSWDVDQIEVLKGPQGARYGANAIAGLINVRSNAAPAEFELRSRLDIGDDDMIAAGVAVGGPLTDRTNARLSAYRLSANGFRDNPFLGRDDTNGRDEAELRLKLSTQINEQFSIDASAFYIDADNGYDAFALDNDFTVYSDKPGRDAQRSVAASLRAEYTPNDAYQFVSISSAARSDINFDFDADWGNADFWQPFTYDFISQRDRIRETLSQEFRLLGANERAFDNRGLDWVLGVYALKLREDLRALDAGVYADPAFGVFESSSLLSSDYSAVNSALFGEMNASVAPRWELSVGARIERRDADYADTSGLSLNPTETMGGGHIGLRFAWRDSTDVYLRAARGFKAGGFNLGSVPAERREFDAEFVTSVEFGVNTQFADDRLQLKAAVFIDARDDQQISTSAQLVPNDPSTFVFFIDNAASGDSAGLELESQWAITEALSVYLNVGILQTEIDLDAAGSSLDGRDQAHAPNYTFATGVRYVADSGWFARLDLSGKDRFYFSNGHDERSSAYRLLNARVGYDFDQLRVSLWGRNLSNERYAVRGFFFGNEPPDFPDTNYVRLGDPRQIGVSFDWRY